MFALVDCNNFYASCQRVFEPHLRGKPIVILSNNDGCVISRSDEAKALGIPMAIPAFKYEAIFKEKNILRFANIFDWTVLKPLRTLSKKGVCSYIYYSR